MLAIKAGHFGCVSSLRLTHSSKRMYELLLGMKTLIQRGSKPFIQRENSVLKIRQHICLKQTTNKDLL